MNTELIEAIEAVLPQTQCTKCGYAGCRPYAEALVTGSADINQCPPGGAEAVRQLAHLLGRAEKPLNPANGKEGPRTAALIDESRCIGCLLCIRACPVDAIVGAAKRMHTVLTQFCTGCELCVPPCPVNCIDMVELDTLAQGGNQHAALLASQPANSIAFVARKRFQFHLFRMARAREERSRWLAQNTGNNSAGPERHPRVHDDDRKKATVQAAIERARARRSAYDKR